MERENFDKAQQTRKYFTQRVNEVRNDGFLSDAGRKAQIAKLYVEYRSDVAQHREQHRLAQRAKQVNLERELFGATDTSGGFDTISYRDAMDRVDQLGRQDVRAALALFDRAVITNDEPMRKALLMRAFREGWDDLVAREIEVRPDVSDQLTELKAVVAQTSGTQGKLEEMAMFGLPKPDEIRGMNDAALEEAAAEPTPKPARGPRYAAL